ncbi:hypothetical protein FHR20_004102 [Sphingomonas leidyi]|jgi:hypothetical protein|uniref:Uncharacterized protein n=1 Tax=Sphingomonas leidyi TaxID=68569 RepID=A0A7X5ZXT3_9SPHN|nr:hypothetical protein [Sphingomonas leidyi]NIJ67124.1 hypothetical protein [Sphingomonas leidyi]
MADSTNLRPFLADPHPLSRMCSKDTPRCSDECFLPGLKKLRSFLPDKTWEDWMSALYIGLAVVCVVGVSACLGGMYLILRSTPSAARADSEA